MGAVSHEDRIARARAALASAEQRTGARSLARGPAHGPAHEDGTAALAVAVLGQGVPAHGRPVRPAAVPSGPVAVPDLPVVADRGVSDPAVVADPPAVADPARTTPPLPAPARPGAPARASRGSVLLTDRPPLAVPPALTPLLPDGLRRGSTTAVLGSTSLVLAMIAAACTAREAWAAVVGQPSLGLLAAAQSGVALDRLAVVPRPGVDTPTVVAALLDGIDVVVVGPGAHLTDADRRRLMARARDRGSVLLSTAPWPGAGTVLTVEGGRWTGVGDGDGRLRAHELHVTRTGRGSAGQAQDLRVVLPLEVGTDPYGIPDRPARPVVEAPAPGLRLVG